MMNYWGFDLGDGESTLARVGSGGVSYPEIVDVDGKKVTITVWPPVPPLPPYAVQPASSGAFWISSPTARP